MPADDDADEWTPLTGLFQSRLDLWVQDVSKTFWFNGAF